jgi:histone acetyltransferase MYST1
VRYRDGAERLAKIIERNFQVDNQWTYYVHYFDFNRRNDEWIDISRIVCPPSVANQLEEKYQQLHTKHSQQLPEKNAAPPSSSSRGKESHSTHELRYTTVADLDHDEHEGFDEESLLEHERVTKVKNIQYVQLGRHIMECWYFSPFPKEYYPNGYADCLYFCEFSLRFFRTKEELVRFQQKSQTALPRHPPGHEIYRDDNLSMFEIDGAVEKIYSQNLCYLAKLFLDHKTLYWDVDPFLFYVLCTRDSRGFHPVGYFSKEKYSEAGYNLACILSFPSVQRKGYGRFLIEFSYELSKKEEKVGSPEKPLSDLGALGYRSYWASTIVRFLRQCGQTTVSIMDITCATSILPDDVISTLELLGLLRDPATAGGQEPAIYAPTDLLEELMRKYPEARMKVDADKLHWTPFYTVDPKKDKWSIVSMKSATGPSAPSAATAPATAAAQPMEM